MKSAPACLFTFDREARFKHSRGRIDVLERILRLELTGKDKLQGLSIDELEERLRRLETKCFE